MNYSSFLAMKPSAFFLHCIIIFPFLVGVLDELTKNRLMILSISGFLVVLSLFILIKLTKKQLLLSCILLLFFILKALTSNENSDGVLSIFSDMVVVFLSFLVVLTIKKKLLSIKIIDALFIIIVIGFTVDILYGEMIGTASIHYMPLSFFGVNHRPGGLIGAALPFAQLVSAYCVVAFFTKKWLCLSISIVILVFTYSRNAYLGFLLAIVITLVINKDIKVISVIMLLLIFSVFYFNETQTVARLLSSIDVEQGSNASRIDQWLKSLTLLNDNPAYIIYGKGFGFTGNSSQGNAAYATESYFIKVLVTSGFILFCIFIFGVLKLLNNSRNNPALFGGSICILLQSIFVQNLESPSTLVILIILQSIRWPDRFVNDK